MTGRTVFTQIQIEFIVFLFQIQFCHPLFQLLIGIFSLASADDLTDSRNQTVHSRHGFAVLILFHVESLDLLRIVCDKYRAFKDLFGKVSLMLGLKVAAPGYLIIELIIYFFQKFYGLCVGHMGELRVQHMI